MSVAHSCASRERIMPALSSRALQMASWYRQPGRFDTFSGARSVRMKFLQGTGVFNDLRTLKTLVLCREPMQSSRSSFETICD